MNKQQLANKIWESANKMRSKIEANEYKDYILGFIFYKFLSDKEVKYLKSIGFDDDTMEQVTEDAGELVENVQKNIGYFISYENLFSTWLSIGSDFNVSNVRDALSAFSRLIDASHKKVFDKIFDTLQTGLSKLGDSSGTQTKAISDLIHLIKDIPMDGKQDYDVLGFIYEYLISNFAANAGKKAGEFYTPHEVSLLMSEIVANHLKDRTEIKIYDPTSGSGSLLINIGKSVAKYMGSGDKIKYYAQELKENTYNLTRMNLVMRGIIPSNIVTAYLSLSCFSRFCSVLIMGFQLLLFMGFDGSFQRLIVEIDRLKFKLLRLQHFRAQPCPEELLRRHAVIGYEAHSGKGSRAENTHPRNGLCSHIGLEQKIQSDRNHQRQDRKNELPHGQSEKHGFGVVPNLPIDFHFQMNSSFTVPSFL